MISERSWGNADSPPIVAQSTGITLAAVTGYVLQLRHLELSVRKGVVRRLAEYVIFLWPKLRGHRTLVVFSLAALMDGSFWSRVGRKQDRLFNWSRRYLCRREAGLVATPLFTGRSNKSAPLPTQDPKDPPFPLFLSSFINIPTKNIHKTGRGRFRSGHTHTFFDKSCGLNNFVLFCTLYILS